METKSNKKQSILLIVFLVAILTLSAIFFTACMSEEEAFEKYGKENAFNKDAIGNLYFVRNYDTVDFYLDPSLDSDWLSAAKYAIAKANAITDALTITGDGKPYPGTNNARYKISYVDEFDWEVLARAYFSYTGGSGKIEIYKEADIVSNDNLKRVIVMHEIGHVIGLTHPNLLVANESVMTEMTSLFLWGVDDYGRFDKANIKWMYEEYKPAH